VPAERPPVRRRCSPRRSTPSAGACRRTTGARPRPRAANGAANGHGHAHPAAPAEKGYALAEGAHPPTSAVAAAPGLEAVKVETLTVVNRVAAVKTSACTASASARSSRASRRPVRRLRPHDPRAQRGVPEVHDVRFRFRVLVDPGR